MTFALPQKSDTPWRVEIRGACATTIKHPYLSPDVRNIARRKPLVRPLLCSLSMANSIVSRLVSVGVVAVAAMLGLAGCSAQTGDEDPGDREVGTSADALGSSLTCNVANLGTQACQDVLKSVGLQAYATSRSEIIDRALHWVNLGVIYDGRRTHDGYRADCSGFVSMAWQYKAQPDTASFPPISTSGKYAFELDGFDDLVPGDAVNRKTRIKNREGVFVGHVMLFAGWASFDRQEMFFIHESAPGKPTELIRARRSSIQDCIPIRATNAPPPAPPA